MGKIMTTKDLVFLQKSVDKVIRFRCTDGEIITVKVDEVDMQDQEVVYEMLSTSDESKYEKHDLKPAYLIRFNDIASVEPVDDL
jgi:hypothetical protein